MSTTAKGVSSCDLGKNRANTRKPGKKRALERSISCFEARFFVLTGKNSPKMLVYFLEFLALQRTPKRVEGERFEPCKVCVIRLLISKTFGIICNAIYYRQQQLAKLDELIKARFVEMFGKGYPEDTLLNLCNIIDYRGKTPEKVDLGLPFITAKKIRMHQMNMEPREYISKETYDKVMVRGFPKEGDVVFTTEAPLGNDCRIPHFDTEFYIGQRIVTLQTTKLVPAYLEYALTTEEFKRKYKEKSSGSTVTGIRVRLLEQLTIPEPPMELQRQFETFVNQVDKSILSVAAVNRMFRF